MDYNSAKIESSFITIFKQNFLTLERIELFLFSLLEYMTLYVFHSESHF